MMLLSEFNMVACVFFHKNNKKQLNLFENSNIYFAGESRNLINPIKQNVISHSYQIGPVHYHLRVVGCFFYILIQIVIEHSLRKKWKP